MPIRSPRRIYQIQDITKNVNDDPNAIDAPLDEDPNGSEVFIFAKIKQGIGDFLGLTPLQWDDAIFRGNFKEEGDALNRGASYHRNIGGFRVGSYKLIAETKFRIKEQYYSPVDNVFTETIGEFKTMSIGLPKGHKVWQVKRWLGGLENFDQIRAMVTPKGHLIDLYSGN